MPKSLSVEHLVTLKIWMKTLEESNRMGIINTLDIEKIFDKECLMDIMYTLWKKAGIDEKDYRLWYKLNEDTEIAVRTSVGESKTEIVKNSVGQGSFGAALASSLNIGCAVQDAFKGKKSTSIGHLDLNSLIMQDDISNRARPIIGFTDYFSRYRYRYRYIGSDITNIGISIFGICISIC